RWRRALRPDVSCRSRLRRRRGRPGRRPPAPRRAGPEGTPVPRPGRPSVHPPSPHRQVSPPPRSRYRFSGHFSTSTDGPPDGAGDPGGMDLRATVEHMFAPARHPRLVGVELELISVTDTPQPRPVAPEWLVAGFDAGFVRAAALIFEPGGQLELS